MLLGKPEMRKHPQNPGVDRKISSVWEGVEWIRLAQDRGKWQALANTTTNLRVP